jgi:hypothetical protein
VCLCRKGRQEVLFEPNGRGGTLAQNAKKFRHLKKIRDKVKFPGPRFTPLPAASERGSFVYLPLFASIKLLRRAAQWRKKTEEGAKADPLVSRRVPSPLSVANHRDAFTILLEAEVRALRVRHSNAIHESLLPFRAGGPKPLLVLSSLPGFTMQPFRQPCLLPPSLSQDGGENILLS